MFVCACVFVGVFVGVGVGVCDCQEESLRNSWLLPFAEGNTGDTPANGGG